MLREVLPQLTTWTAFTV